MVEENIILTEEEAFVAMQFFLDDFYPHWNSQEDPRAIFTFISFCANVNKPVDPGIWGKWLKCVRRVKAGEDPIRSSGDDPRMTRSPRD